MFSIRMYTCTRLGCILLVLLTYSPSLHAVKDTKEEDFKRYEQGTRARTKRTQEAQQKKAHARKNVPQE